MKPPVHFDEPRSLKLRNRVDHQSNSSEMLELLLALDRSVIEVSMQLYGVDPDDRRNMRSQNRRYQATVRNQFPRLIKAAQRKTRGI